MFLEQDGAEKWEQMPGCLSRSQQLLTSLAPPAICWPGLSPTDMLASRKTKNVLIKFEIAMTTFRRLVYVFLSTLRSRLCVSES